MSLWSNFNVSTADAFFCQASLFHFSCVSAAEFSSRNFSSVCPSGNCVDDCQRPGNMYTDASEFYTLGIFSDAAPPLYSICLATPAMARVLANGLIPAPQADALRPIFTFADEAALQSVASTTTHCLINTCDRSVKPEFCSDVCSPAELISNSSTPSLNGIASCLNRLCTSQSSLPFANQDIFGPGVSLSYLTQSVLALMLWGALAIPDLLHRVRRRSYSKQASKFQEKIVSTLADFQKAQCYFTITIMAAALSTGIFISDPVNAYALLPVAVNGILAETFTLVLVYRYGSKSWYIFDLTVISWALSSLVAWTTEHYLITSGQLSDNTVEVMEYLAAATKHMSSIDSCGGTSGLNLCTWNNGSSPVGTFPYFADAEGGRLNRRACAANLAICTIYLCGLLSCQLSPQRQDATGPRPAMVRSLSRLSPVQSLRSRIVPVMTGTPMFCAISLGFFVSFGYQLAVFDTFLDLHFVNLSAWGFGQVVAVAVWVPPVVEFIHLLFNGIIDGHQYKFTQSLTVARTSLTRSPKSTTTRQSTYHPLSDTGHDEGLHLNTSPPQAYEPYRETADHVRGDEVGASSAVENRGGEGSFPLRSRNTVHLEEGQGYGTRVAESEPNFPPRPLLPPLPPPPPPPPPLPPTHAGDGQGGKTAVVGGNIGKRFVDGR